MTAFLQATDKSLRIMRRVCKASIRVLGIVLIDQLMRSIVEWYDKRGRKSGPRRMSRSPADAFAVPVAPVEEQQPGQWQNEKSALEARLKTAQATIGRLEGEIEKLRVQNHDYDVGYRAGQDEVEKARKRVDGLQTELSDLRKRAMPAEYVPGTILYAEADADSGNLRKAGIYPQASSLYEIHTLPGDLTQGEFLVLNPVHVATVILNRTITLKACHIESISAEANHILTVSKGKVSKNGKNWQLVQPAVVRLINR